MNIEQPIGRAWQVLSRIDTNRHEPPTVAEVIARRAMRARDRMAYLTVLAEPEQCGDPALIAARRHVADMLLERISRVD